MQLNELLDVNELEREIKDGYVDRRYHRTLPLTIYCYSRKATYENHWNEVTELCRGLIVDAQGTVVGRPFRKFFNLDTVDRPETHISSLPTNHPPIVFDKLDGSLGTVWRYGSFTGVASKGSFQSEHANWASYWYTKHCPNPQWPEGYTPVVEMICQSVQRHVVNYDMHDQLILLALINNETGEELPYNDLYHYAYLNGLRVADIFHKTVGDIVLEDRPNKEGYVLSYPREGQTPLKIKVKHETFLKLQKLVHSVSVRSIFEALTEGRRDILETWINQTTPELGSLVQGWVGRFVEAYGHALVAARNQYLHAQSHSESRAEFANLVKDSPVAPLIFGMLDDKDQDALRAITWKLVGKKMKDDLGKQLVYADPEDDEDDR